MSTPLKTEIISDALEALRRHLKAIGFVGLTILVWDHAITFADEVEIIWGRPKNFLTCLFLLNRYLTPIGFVVNLVAYSLPSWSFIVRAFRSVRGGHDSNWDPSRGADDVPALALGCCVTAKLVAWSSLFLPSGRANRVLRKGLASAWAWVPLCYDTVVFALTLNRTLPSIQNKEAGHVVRALFADGVLFYSVMCAINLIFTIMIVRAPQGLKNITGQLELM
ncbi:uncharacterized protein EDB91DRAFT_1081158 [Suillus paluster]|uniref:uncharacterized protein n=1 Tax=Suillus paluster TaxID=48578 RepID=UPI001B86A043|nr:uncharacterized protein EDB91DRAFT_1081158 [Suillus paluster]KAG1743200.1 hypothetical protein EDB91DRAFT_1081158 [Suillus paluster]